MATKKTSTRGGEEDPLNQTLCDLTLAELINLGILGIDNNKRATAARGEASGQFAMRLSKEDMKALVAMIEAAGKTPAADTKVAATRTAAAKKAPAKKAAAKKAAAKKAPAKKAPAKKAAQRR